MMQRDGPSSSVPRDTAPGTPAAPAESVLTSAHDIHRGRLFRKYLLLILSLVTAVL